MRGEKTDYALHSSGLMMRVSCSGGDEWGEELLGQVVVVGQLCVALNL